MDFRAALLAVPPDARDAWLDAQLGIAGVADDGPDLPRGCTPYLPAPVAALLEVAAWVTADDVVVDVGAGVGRAAAALHRLTGARAIGIEIQAALVAAAVPGATLVQRDAAEAADVLAAGTVFFLYTPFGGARLAKVLADLAALDRAITVCALDLPPLAAAWLEVTARPSEGLAIYRSSSSGLRRQGSNLRPGG